MKFYSTMRRADYAAIASGLRTVSEILPTTPDSSAQIELQTYPFVPEKKDGVLVEIDIHDDHIDPEAEMCVCDTHGRHFLLTADLISHARVRCVSDEEVDAFARAEIDLCMLPSPTRVRDIMALHTRNQRRNLFGPWLARAFEELNADSAGADVLPRSEREGQGSATSGRTQEADSVSARRSPMREAQRP